MTKVPDCTPANWAHEEDEEDEASEEEDEPVDGSRRFGPIGVGCDDCGLFTVVHFLKRFVFLGVRFSRSSGFRPEPTGQRLHFAVWKRSDSQGRRRGHPSALGGQSSESHSFNRLTSY